MKRIIIVVMLFINLFIPFFVYAEEKDKYVLILTQSFLELSDSYSLNNEPTLDQKIDYYKNSHLSIRDYLLFKSICKSMGYTSATELKDGTKFSVDELDDYYVNEKEKIKILNNYSSIEVKIVNNKQVDNTSSLNFTDIEQFLDSDIYCYFLFSELIKDSSSSLKFVKLPDKDKYGYIARTSNDKVLLNINLKNNYIVFDVPKDVEVSDNTSFLQLDSISKNVDIDYLSIIFSNSDKNTNKVKADRFNQDLIFFGICAFLSIFIISLLVKGKGK